MRVAQLRVLGGAMARVSAQATAFAHRSAAIMANVAAFYGVEERAAREVWARDFEEALRQGEANKGMMDVRELLGEEGEGGYGMPTLALRGRGSLRSRAATTPPTSSASTTTSRPPPSRRRREWLKMYR